MFKIIAFIVIITTGVFVSCKNSDKKIFLKGNKKQKDETIQFETTKYSGNFINAIQNINGIKIHYNIRLASNGKILHVLKRDQKYYEQGNPTLDLYRNLHTLVTDTIKNDPTFFGHSINGFFGEYAANNIIYDDKNRKTSLMHIQKEEWQLFFEIDSLMSIKKLNYIQFDSSRVLGWFNYVF